MNPFFNGAGRARLALLRGARRGGREMGARGWHCCGALGVAGAKWARRARGGVLGELFH